MNTVYRDLEPQQIYRLHENEKKRQYSSRVLDIEHGTFTPLIFTTGGMGKEYLNYHSKLSRVDCYQERRGLCQNNLMATSKNLICTSEIRIKDGAYCYCAYVLRISRYSDFPIADAY